MNIPQKMAFKSDKNGLFADMKQYDKQKPK